MCGIIGYVGSHATGFPGGRAALPIIVAALERMEYRGYDSAGVAIISPDPASGGAENSISIVKKAGRITHLYDALDKTGAIEGTSGIGHTRWATHGRPVDRNAHPHSDVSGQFAVVHNGIIENYSELKEELVALGYQFQSDTDTEVAVQLLHRYYSHGPTQGNFSAAAGHTIARLQGAFTVLFTCVHEPDTIIGARRSTPLVVGVGRGEMFLASDVAAFIEYTRDAVELGQDNIVIINSDGYQITDFSGNPAEGTPFHIDWNLAAAEKGGYEFFMDKEIAEQPTAVADTLRGHVHEGRIILDEQRLSDGDLRDIDKVFIVACGSAFHAGLVAKYAIEHWARVPVEVELASEFRYRDPVLDTTTLVIAISQSGETLDTLEALRHAKEQGALVIAISNTVGSQIPRESAAVVYTHAGPEVAVASTKCFLAQIVGTYLVGLAIAGAKGIMFADEIERECHELTLIPRHIQRIVDDHENIRSLARNYGTHSDTILYIGRHVGYPVALEGALKMKELAYIHAEGFAAGELKHGPIALLSEGVPTIIVMPSPQSRSVLHAKMVSNIREIQARGAHTIVIAQEGDTSVRPYADALYEVPQTSTLYSPLVATVPLQIFASEVARLRGYDVDKPRNLAKSVTVE